MKKSEIIMMERVAGLYSIVSAFRMALEDIEHYDIPNDMHDKMQLIIMLLKDLCKLAKDYHYEKLEEVSEDEKE